MNMAVKSHITLDEVKSYLVKELASMIEVDINDIDNEVEFDRYGLDSAQAVELTDNISTWLGQEIDPTLLYDYSTINTLSQHLLTLNVSDSAPANVQEASA